MAADHVTAPALAAGLSIFGISTGLEPAVLIAGFAGGVWAQSYQPPVHWLKRILMTTVASIIAGYTAPVAAIGFASFEAVRGIFTPALLQLPVAVLIGLTTHTVLGPAIIRWGTKKADVLIEKPQKVNSHYEHVEYRATGALLPCRNGCLLPGRACAEPDGAAVPFRRTFGLLCPGPWCHHRCRVDSVR